MGFVIAELSHLPQPTFTQCGEINGCCQSHECFVGGNIGGCSLPSDVLFTGGEGEHIACLTLSINCLAHNSPRHLAEVLLATGENA